MGVIKKRFSAFVSIKVKKKLADELMPSFADSGLSSEQVESLCLKVAIMARNSMNNEYVVMGGYSPEEQLLDASRKLIHELDEQEKLVCLLDDENAADAMPDDPIPSESDLEDAYHAADSIRFTGSEKQIKWAKDIATANNTAIALSGLTFNQLPTSAKWWIENRSDLISALRNIKHA